MFKKIALVLLAVIICILGYAATKPSSYTVARQKTMKAPPEKIFAMLDDFHAWGQWSPWEKLDPNMKRTYSGPASGVGAAYAWTGNSDVGSGRMEITEATPSSRLVLRLDFLTPFESHNTTEFTLAPRGDSTTLTWTMTGPSPYITKLMTVFASMDKMIGKDFEAGLGNLKLLAER